jgi:hypothetical protein
MVKKHRTDTVSRDEAREFARAAREFLEQARSSLDSGSFRAAATLAVHAAISGTDALLGSRFCIRSCGQDHLAAADLLRTKAPASLAGEWGRQAERLRRIIAKKNLVEYEGCPITGKEAKDLVVQSARFVDWVRENFGNH